MTYRRVAIRVVVCRMIVCLFICTVTGAEERPFKTMDSGENIAVLKSLTERLNAGELNAEIISAALMAYVNLALDDDQRAQGNRGLLWIDRARELQRAVKEESALGGVNPIPELWLDALDGHGKRVMEKLQELRLFATPEGRAIEVFITADFRVLNKGLPSELTAHEYYALGRAYERCGLDVRLQSLPYRSDLPAIGWSYIKVKGAHDPYRYMGEHLRQVFSTIDRVIEGVPDRNERPWLMKAISTVAGETDRSRQRIDGYRRRLANGPQWSGEHFRMAWYFCDKAMGFHSDLKGPDGEWMLYSPVLWAKKMRMELLMSAWDWHHALVYEYAQPERAEQFAVAIQEGRSDILSAVIEMRKEKHDIRTQLIECAMVAESANRDGLPLAILFNMLRGCPGLDQVVARNLRGRFVYMMEERSTQRGRWTSIPFSSLALLDCSVFGGCNQDEHVQMAHQNDPWRMLWYYAKSGNHALGRGTVAWETTKSHPWRVDQFHWAARRGGIHDNWASIADYSRQGREVDNGSTDLIHLNVIALDKLKRYAEAIQILEDYLMYEGAAHTTYMTTLLAQMHRKNGNEQAAAECHRLAAATENSYAMIKAAEDAHAEGDFQAAVAYYRKEYERYGTVSSLLKVALLCYEDPACSRDDVAKTFASIKLQDSPGHHRLWELCNAYRKLGLQDELLAMMPDDPIQNIGLAYIQLWCLIDIGRFEEALGIAEHHALALLREGRHPTHIAYLHLYWNALLKLTGHEGLTKEQWDAFDNKKNMSVDIEYALRVVRGQASRYDVYKLVRRNESYYDAMYWIAMDLIPGEIDFGQKRLLETLVDKRSGTQFGVAAYWLLLRLDKKGRLLGSEAATR